jgi:hypothetical protein
MTSKNNLRTWLVVSIALVLTFCAGTGMSLLQAAEEPAGTAPAASSAVPPAPTPANTVPTPAPKPVHLRVDGHLAGKISVPGATGAGLGGRTQITVFKGGEIVNSVGTDELGNFQMDGVQPGEYIVRGQGPSGSFSYPIKVLPYDPAGSLEASTLSMDVTPNGAVLAQAPDPAPVPAPVPTDYGYAGGGGGGSGGGGGWGALGAVGMGMGIAGLATGVSALATKSSSTTTLASPSTP